MDSEQQKWKERKNLAHIWKSADIPPDRNSRNSLFLHVFSLFDVLTGTARTKRKRKLSHINAGRGNADVVEIYDCTQLIWLYYYVFCVFRRFTTLSPLWHVNNVDFKTIFSLSIWLSRSLCNFSQPHTASTLISKHSTIDNVSRTNNSHIIDDLKVQT